MPITHTQTDILARLSDTDRDALSHYGQIQQFAKGEFVFHAGASGKHVCFLRRGRVKIYQSSPTGKEVILWFCFAGDIFGLAEGTLGGDRTVNALACEKSEVLILSQSQFAAFIQSHPNTALLMMQILSGRLRALSDVIINLVNDDVQTRIMKLIMRLGAHHYVRVGDDTYLDIRLTHQEIADMIGTTRQTVSSLLNALKRQGLLYVKQHCIHIMDEKLLGELANQAHLAAAIGLATPMTTPPP